MSYRELLIGCGNHRDKVIASPDHRAWENLTTLDIDPDCGADVLHDINDLPLPFEDESFDEIHTYHCLEHLGQQGDWRTFFRQFDDLYRILKPGGLLCIISPSLNSPWLWGDPGHTRVISSESLTFLDQAEYQRQVGKTALTDYRHVWKGDFAMQWHQDDADNRQFMCVLRAIKPAGSQMDERVPA